MANVPVPQPALLAATAETLASFSAAPLWVTTI
jgi:hypothetical protein